MIPERWACHCQCTKLTGIIVVNQLIELQWDNYQNKWWFTLKKFLKLLRRLHHTVKTLRVVLDGQAGYIAWGLLWSRVTDGEMGLGDKQCNQHLSDLRLKAQAEMVNNYISSIGFVKKCLKIIFHYFLIQSIHKIIFLHEIPFLELMRIPVHHEPYMEACLCFKL